jgi:hypothetical protein
VPPGAVAPDSLPSVGARAVGVLPLLRAPAGACGGYCTEFHEPLSYFCQLLSVFL